MFWSAALSNIHKIGSQYMAQTIHFFQSEDLIRKIEQPATHTLVQDDLNVQMYTADAAVVHWEI